MAFQLTDTTGKRLLLKALTTYGPEAQMTMVFEEMSELQKELCKNLRGKTNVQEIAEEIADVEIMLAQMKILFDVEERVGFYTEDKLSRLAKRLGV